MPIKFDPYYTVTPKIMNSLYTQSCGLHQPSSQEYFPYPKIADSTSINIQEKMSKAFYQSSILQYYFWDDAYKLKVYDKVFNL